MTQDIGQAPVATPADFFRPGHTYSTTIFGGPFTVDFVGTHPATGERFAHGWVHYEHDDSWAPQVVTGLFDRFTDITKAGEDRWEKEATAGSVPDFFQPGHSYLYPQMQWKFRCDAVTSHPHTGKRVAVGYSGFGPGDWQTSDLSEGVWADGAWTDITAAGEVPA
ncbi:hypothetical protein [Streptomyces anandii]|uniref:hypothetical protein n=1 Tax=Streptomyces anandii TaxID=285454 RepID=UPI00379E5869